MAFQNDIVAGEELIRESIKSANYFEGATGWKIGRDGTAEFEDLVTRGDLTADTGQFDTLTLSGDDVSTLFANRPDKHLAAIVGFANSTNENWAAGTNNLLCTISWTMKANVDYMVYFSGAEIASATVGDNVYITYRYAWDGAVPTAASPILWGGNGTTPPSRGANGNPFVGYPVGIASSPTDRVITVGLFFVRNVGAGATIYQWSGAGAIFWAEEKGFDIPRGGTKYTPASSVYTATRYDYTYWYTSAQSYNEAGNQSSASNASIYAYQGDGDAVGNPGGNHQSLFFFPSAQMVTDLSGATIISTYVYLDNVHCYLNSGVDCVIGTHNSNPTPGTLPGGITADRWTSPRLHIAKGGDGWTGDLGTTLGGEFKGGTTKGMVVGYGSPNDVNWYSYFNRCAVRIIFDK